MRLPHFLLGFRCVLPANELVTGPPPIFSAATVTNSVPIRGVINGGSPYEVRKLVMGFIAVEMAELIASLWLQKKG